MANGIINLTQSGGGAMAGRILWSSESNGIEKNSSNVTAELQIRKTNNATTTGTWKGSLTVGSRTQNISVFQAVDTSWFTVATLTATISHKADGSGVCYIHAKVNGPTQTTQSGVSVSGSESVALDPITRFATLIAATEFNDTAWPTISYTNPAGESVDTLQACILLNDSTEIVKYRDISKTGSTHTFSLTENERDALRAATPNSNVLPLTFCLRTVIGENENVDSLNSSMIIVLAEPVVSVTVEDTNSATRELTGDSAVLIANHSSARVSVSATPQKHATIQSNGIRITQGDITLSGNGTITPVTNNPIVVTVTDSRGNITSTSVENTIIPYFDPTVIVENSMISATGDLQLVVSGAIYAGSFGAAENQFSVQYRYRVGSGNYLAWNTFPEAALNGNDYVATVELTGLDYKAKYSFQARVIDLLNPDGVLSTDKKFVSDPIFDWSQYDFRFQVPVDMSGHRIFSLAAPVDSADAVTLGFLRTLGLGAGGQDAKDLNDAVTGGWFSFGSTSDGYANIPFNYGVAFVLKRFNDDVVQIAINTQRGGSGVGQIAIRSNNGTWQPWEYVNPPMSLGTEYRTIDRYLGKPVYEKTVNFGTLPISSEKSANYSDVSATPIHVALLLSDGCVLNAGYGKDRSFNTAYGINVDATDRKVRVHTESDFSGLSAYVHVRYTKN